MKNRLLTVSLSPHAFGGFSVPGIMRDVIIALLPSLAVAVYVFGPDALKVTLLAVASAVLCEYLLQRYVLKVKPSISDGSAVVTGMLLAYNLPSSLPWWMVVAGSVFAIGVGKMSFGGLGKNPFNPALVGRVFLLMSFPVQMTSWPKPFIWRSGAIDGLTAATPLAVLKEGVKNGQAISQIAGHLPSYADLFLGRIGGCIGEISALALLVGFIYLLARKVVTWHIPSAMVGTIAIFTGVLWLRDPQRYADPLFQILSGGILLGAIFMATDYVTSPMTVKGMMIYGVGIGVITVVIRVFGAYPEGVSFAILIMNAFVPMINRYCKPRRFGEGKKIHG